MIDGAGSVDCSGDRGDMASGGTSGQIYGRLISTTPFATATQVRGVTVEGRLRDYSNSGSAATRYQLGCLNGTTFTPFGTVDEFSDTSTTTDFSTDISSLTGTCNAGDSLALYIYRVGTGQYRFYTNTTHGAVFVEQFE
jgi:hypothetical protein